MLDASSFYLRDIKLNNDPKIQITNALKKLGYLDLDYENRQKKYIETILSKMILNSNIDYNKSFSFYIEQIKETNEYKQYNEYLLYSHKRYEELKKHILDSKLKDFYDNCTKEELAYLGY